MKIEKLSIIVPVYNEKATVEKVIRELEKLNLGGRKKEAIVVDDGSTDGTTEILLRLKRQIIDSPTSLKLRGVHKFIFKKRNQGKGAAIRTGLARATGDYVIIHDADLEYDPRDIPKLLKKAEENGWWVVFGSRDKEIKNRYLYPHYYWGSRALCLLINWLFGEKYTDPETCYKLMKRGLWEFLDLEEKGFGVEIEVTTKVARLEVPWGEVSISYHPRSFAEGKKIGVRDGLRAVWLIIKYWLNDLHYGVVDQWLRRERFKAVLKYLKWGKKDAVVDMGCGREASLGWYLRGKVGWYIGLDKEMIDLKMGNLRFIRADIDGLPKNLKILADGIVGAAILEHLKHPEIFLEKCFGMLRPGGQIALTTPVPPMAGWMLEILAAAGVIKADEIDDHVGYFGLDELVKIVTGLGFKMVKAEKFLGGLNCLIVAEKP
jgi:dolichol-phosphate mannosyltransferase